MGLYMKTLRFKIQRNAWYKLVVVVQNWLITEICPTQKEHALSIYIETDSDVKYNKKGINGKIFVFLKNSHFVCLE